MSALAPAFAAEIAATFARPGPLQRHIYRAWHQSGEELDIAPARDLTEAADRAVVQCGHKAHFSVLEVDTFDRIATEHLFYVSKSSKAGTFRRAHDGNYPVFEGNHQHKLLLSRAMLAFAPVAPWCWSQDDPTGFKHGRLPANSPLLDGAS